MQSVSAFFSFIKSTNWPTNAGVATGDPFGMLSLVISIILLGVSFSVALSICIIVFKNKILAANSSNFVSNSRFNINKFSNVSIIIGSLILAAIVTFSIFEINRFIAVANSEDDICSMSNISVSVLETGVESVDQAVVYNNSEKPVSVNSLELSVVDQIASDAILTINYSGEELYKGKPEGSSEEFLVPIIIAPNAFAVFDVGISMDPVSAVSLIDKNPIQLSFLYKSAYSIAVENDGHGTAASNPVYAFKDAEISLTSTSTDVDYEFDKWVAIEPSTLDIQNDKFKMPDQDVTVKATFKIIIKNYDLKTDGNGTWKEGGSTITSIAVAGTTVPSPAEDTGVINYTDDQGSSHTATPSPTLGYEFETCTFASNAFTATFKKIVVTSYKLETDTKGKWQEGTSEVTTIEVVGTVAPVPSETTGEISYTAIDGQHTVKPVANTDFRFLKCEYNKTDLIFKAYFVDASLEWLVSDGYRYLPIPGGNETIFYDSLGEKITPTGESETYTLSDVKNAFFFTGEDPLITVRSINNVSFDTLYPEDPKTSGNKNFNYESDWAKAHLLYDEDGNCLDTIANITRDNNAAYIGYGSYRASLADLFSNYNPMESDPEGFGGQWGNFWSSVATTTSTASTYSCSYEQWAESIRELDQNMCVCVTRVFNATKYNLVTDGNGYWAQSDGESPGGVVTSFLTPKNAEAPEIVEAPSGFIVASTAIDGSTNLVMPVANKSYEADTCTLKDTTLTATFKYNPPPEITDIDESLFDNVLLILCSLWH